MISDGFLDKKQVQKMESKEMAAYAKLKINQEEVKQSIQELALIAHLRQMDPSFHSQACLKTCAIYMKIT